MSEAWKLVKPMLLTSTLVKGAFYYNNLNASASFRVTLLFAGLPLCPDQATYLQAESLRRTNGRAVTKKS